MLKFQFTLPCRERLRYQRMCAITGAFQFTLPCRERLRSNSGRRGRRCFNSRSRVGSDDNGLVAGVVPRVSIHAPV